MSKVWEASEYVHTHTSSITVEQPIYPVVGIYSYTIGIYLLASVQPFSLEYNQFNSISL